MHPLAAPMSLWSRAHWEADLARYRAEVARLRASGLPEGHPLVEQATRRMKTVERVLSDPAYGLLVED